tara:strand:- start:66 stop:365 length:300 start_codon:yes stop_codon:yes gene_type:complete
METILTVLITLGVVALLVSVVGVIRLKRKVEDLELDRLVFIDELATTRRDLYVELESLNVDTDKYRTTSESNLDRRFDNIWSDVHKLDAVVNPNKHLLK